MSKYKTINYKIISNKNIVISRKGNNVETIIYMMMENNHGNRNY
jgi:hypothetical protein